MSRLQDLLLLPDVSEIKKDIYISKQLGSFVVEPLTEKQLQGYRIRSKKKDNDIDVNKLNCLVIENHVIDPNLKDADFLEKAKCDTVADFINRKFTAGTTARIVNKIMEISDLSDIDKDIEEAKNL